MVRVIVEREFPEPVEFASLQCTESRSAWCLEQHGVKPVRSYFSVDRRRMFCEYEAPDAESVRIAQTKAHMPFTRVWVADVIEPEP